MNETELQKAMRLAEQEDMKTGYTDKISCPYTSSDTSSYVKGWGPSDPLRECARLAAEEEAAGLDFLRQELKGVTAKPSGREMDSGKYSGLWEQLPREMSSIHTTKFKLTIPVSQPKTEFDTQMTPVLIVRAKRKKSTLHIVTMPGAILM